MLYLNKIDLERIGINWEEAVGVIGETLSVLGKGDFAQPVKPYLRFRDLKNRIIAMPAYIGGDHSCAGIKWIASFPANLKSGLDRAHSVTVLNNVDNGAPFCIINTNLISGIRTAAVTGLVLKRYLNLRKDQRRMVVGICGFGQIGLLHLKMVQALAGDLVEKFIIFDIVDRSSSVPPEMTGRVKVARSWRECYTDADVFITCSVSERRYIDAPPRAGSLHLNISLRDYFPEVMKNMRHLVVDDWDEVCRENTDIEALHKHAGLEKNGTINLLHFIYADMKLERNDTVMFNPMGMAVFDVAMALHYYRLAKQTEVGVTL